MIVYINKLLNDWARWRVSDRMLLRNQLGAKSSWPAMLGKSDSTETVAQHGTLVPFNDQECCDTDKAVCSLPPDLRDAVMEFYTRIGTAESTARRLGVAVSTLFLRIDKAHWHILGTLNDLAAGIQSAPRPTLSQKTVASGRSKAYKTG